MTEKRLAKIKKVVEARQKNLTIVLENIHDPHNVSAIFRTADAAGVDVICLIYNTNVFPKIGRVSSASAKKWIDVKKFNSVEACFSHLKNENYLIYATHLSESLKNKSLFELNFTKNTAFVLGNEHSGVSEEAAQKSDENVIIPMYGMIQSLNVSVSAAICLYEALRQREKAGMYQKSLYSAEELDIKLKAYISK